MFRTAGLIIIKTLHYISSNHAMNTLHYISSNNRTPHPTPANHAMNTLHYISSKNRTRHPTPASLALNTWINIQFQNQLRMPNIKWRLLLIFSSSSYPIQRSDHSSCRSYHKWRSCCCCQQCLICLKLHPKREKLLPKILDFLSSQ